ncbi:MAG: ABC transporter ATP-binding protein, partial [Minisyncoccia bacterium]
MKEYLHTILRLWKIFTPFHKWFYLQLFLIFLLQILIVSEAVVSSKMMNALVSKDSRIVVIFLFVMLGVALAKIIVDFLETKNSINHLVVTLDQHIQEYSLKRILNLTIEQHTEDHSAMKLTIISQGEQHVRNVIDRIITSIIPTLMLLVIALVTLTFVSPLIALAVGVMFPILLTWAYFFQRSQYPFVTKNRDNWNGQFKTRAEAFSHLSLVKILGQESKFTAHYLAQRAELIPHHFFTQTRGLKNWAKRGIFVEVLSVAAIAFAIYEYLNGSYTLGTIYLIMSMINKIFSNVNTLSNSMREIPQSFVHIEKYLSIIDKEPSFNEDGTRDLSLGEDITFSDVSFQYPKGESPALVHCSFVIPSGKTTAFVGHSGSGKSTIARILLRAYDYTDGAIRIGPNSLRDIDAKYLRENIGYVEQHVDLFDDTVRNNILMALPASARIDAEKRLEEIGEKARISEFYH